MNNEFFKIFRDYKEISLRYDARHQAVWCYYNPQSRPCFTPLMLKEIRQYLHSIINYFNSKSSDAESVIRYLVAHSQVPGVFSMGGDLSHISRLIREKNRSQLLAYATQCIDVLYLHSVSLNLPLTTICLVEGTALGGGFECALSGNVLIATENSEMGFPEIRFNLFPGMGAYSFLARSCGARIAEKIIGGGQIFSAKKLYDMGYRPLSGRVWAGYGKCRKIYAATPAMREWLPRPAAGTAVFQFPQLPGTAADYRTLG